MITAKEIMNEKVVVVTESMGVRELAALLNEKMITGAPAVDDSGNLVGVVSSTDIVRYFGQEKKELRPMTKDHLAYYLRDADEITDNHQLNQLQVEAYDDPATVSTIMTPVVFEVNEDAPLPEIAATMVRGRIHRLIVTRERKVVGIITALDVLRCVAVD